MILSLIFSFVMFASLWPYFMALGIFDFKKNSNEMETPLPGRPARRTVGRINDDMTKGIFAIFAGYIVFAGVFYGTINFSSLLPNMILSIACIIGVMVAIFMMTPSNRQCHAYSNLGHIVVIHLVCSISAFIVFSTFFYDDYLTINEMIALSVIILGSMLTFSRKVYVAPVNKGDEL